MIGSPQPAVMPSTARRPTKPHRTTTATTSAKARTTAPVSSPLAKLQRVP